MNLLALILIFFGGVTLTIGDLVMKKWVDNGSIFVYIVGLLAYMIGMVFLSQSFRFKNIAIASLMLVIFNIVTLLIVSWLFYNEKLSVIQMVGLGLGMLSIVILELE
jgi:multidrug transporter EmrE-like cation transporter